MDIVDIVTGTFVAAVIAGSVIGTGVGAFYATRKLLPQDWDSGDKEGWSIFLGLVAACCLIGGMIYASIQ